MNQTHDTSAEIDRLRQSEAHLRAILKTAADGIVTIDDRGIVLSMNPAVEKIFGYTPEEVIGRNVSMLMPPPYEHEHDGYIQRYLHTGQARIIGIGREVVGQRKNGEIFPIDLAVSEVRDGENRYFTGIIHDITNRKKLEKQLLEISTAEQQRIGRDLHDGLGQELTGIAFLCDVLKQKLQRQEAAEALDAAEITRLVNQAIDHARALVRGLCPVSLDGEDGLQSALKELARAVSTLHELRCRFTSDTAVQIGDHNTATQLYYIAHEAVHNAVKHANATSIDIRLAASNERALLTVTDNGSGIDTARSSSSGRGMEIMPYRARMIGGMLDMRSRVGEGTTVSCHFPLPQAMSRKLSRKDKP